jgi:hypothetical protein
VNPRRVLVAVVALGLVAGSCSDDGPGIDEARLRVDGQATVTDSEGMVEVVTDGATLSFGDTLVVDEGTATMELAAGQVYELRAGDVDSVVLVGSPPTLLAGDALVADGFPAAITYETTTLSAQGALKVRAGVPSASAYAGRARISGAGDLAEVVGLRQVVLTPSAAPEPLVYDASDPWDRRFLGEAIAFGQRLEALARGFTSELQPGGGRSASFFESVVPALADEREFSADLLGDRPPGETLVGASIAVQGRNGTFRERWEAIFAFRDAGAAWGLVALDQGVSSAPVIETIELAIADAPLSADPTTTTTGSTTTTLRPPGAPSPPGDGDPDVTTTTGTSTTTTTTPQQGILDPVLQPVDEMLQDVLEALGLGTASG